MSYSFELGIKGLEGKLKLMADEACHLVELALKSLAQRDDELAWQLQGADAVLEKWEIEIDDLTVQLLSRAPLASDVHFITMALKVSHELERVGDELRTISWRILELNHEPELVECMELSRVVRSGLEMLENSMGALLQRDHELACQMIPAAKQVHSLTGQLHRRLAGCMIEKPACMDSFLNLMTIAKCLERITDHATNIAEEVVFFHARQTRDTRRPGHLSTDRLSNAATLGSMPS